MTVQRKPRRRRASRRAKRGTYTSTRSGVTYTYRSGWEREYMEYLDSDPGTVAWSYESFTIPYVSAVRSGRVRKYIPDFLIECSNGQKIVVEIKPSSRVARPTNAKKFAAAREWCRHNGVEFTIITEIELKALGLLRPLKK